MRFRVHHNVFDGETAEFLQHDERIAIFAVASEAEADPLEPEPVRLRVLRALDDQNRICRTCRFEIGVRWVLTEEADADAGRCAAERCVVKCITPTAEVDLKDLSIARRI